MHLLNPLFCAWVCKLGDKLKLPSLQSNGEWDKWDCWVGFRPMWTLCFCELNYIP